MQGNLLILVLVLAIGALCYLLWWVRSLIKENGDLRDKRGNDADARAERFATVAEGAKQTARDATDAIKGVDHELGELREAVKLQTVGTDAILKGQDAIVGKIKETGERTERVVDDALRGRRS